MSIYDDVAELDCIFDSYCVDPETGEVYEEQEADFEQLKAYILGQGLEKALHFYANKQAEAEALKAEKMRIAKKQQVAENNVERIKRCIRFIYDQAGQGKLQAGTFTVSLRKSTQVILADNFENKDFGVYEFKADKAKIKQAINSGEVIDGAELVDNYNLQIK